MKDLITSNLKVKFLGIIPVLEDKTGILNPQQIVSLAAILSFKGESIKSISEKIKKKGEDLNEKTKSILQKSSLRGHASVATTPVLCLAYEGSKFLDSALTGIIFSSSIMASGRRTQTTEKDIVYPDNIFKNQKAREIYKDVSLEIIQAYNYFLAQGVRKDEASKILQYGIYGTGVIQLPIESIALLKREYLAEKEWMPEEMGFLLRRIEKKLKNLGVDWLYATREVAPRNIYPYPNIFKNPQRSNIVRELMAQEKLSQDTKLISMQTDITPGMKRKLIDLDRKTKKIFKSFQQIKENWLKIISSYQEILRDYNLALRFKVLSRIPWRVWGEKKRHRTVPQVVESIYYCVNRTARELEKFKNKTKEQQIHKVEIKEIEKFFSIPPSIKSNQEFLLKYISVTQKAFRAYANLIRLNIRPREAIFLIPRAVKIDVLQEYDLYNLLTGYYPLRLCSTAEEEMLRNTWNEVSQIKTALNKKGLGFLNKFIVPKCHITGFCPEEKSCSLILLALKNYNSEFHQKMQEELRKQFQKKLNKLG